MTTYEYIIQNRNATANSKTSIHSDVESVGGDLAPPPPMEQLSSSQTTYVEETIRPKEKNSIEMNQLEDDITYVNVAEKEGREPGPIVEKNITTENITYVYEVPENNYGVVDEKPPSSRKKKRKTKSRSSSKVDLIRDEDEEDGSLSSVRSHNSLPSEDEERYIEMKNEKVLRNFQSPTSGRESRSRPVPLSEDTAYASIKETRIESVVSRPRSPSPKQSERISFANQQNDYVMRVADKRASDSSLSTIALQDHDENGKPLSSSNYALSSKPMLSPHREESFESKESSKNSKNSILSARRVEVVSRSDIQEDEEEKEEEKITSVTQEVSQKNEVRSPRASEISQISLSRGRSQSPRRLSAQSELTNLTLASEKIGTLASETELTAPVPQDEKRQDVIEKDLVMSDTATLIFEDEFVNDNDENINFLQQSIIIAEERQRSKSPPDAKEEEKKVLEAGMLSDANSQKIASYVEAFKRKLEPDQFSFGSESAESDSGVPLATLNEDSDSYALSDTLRRVKKLSDAFPTANELDKSKKRSLPHPRFNKHESMSELSVVEYNKKKKLKKKRPSTGSGSKQLPPIRGRRPLPGVTEERDYSDTDA